MNPLLRALGVEDEGEALAAIAEFNTFLSDARAATGVTKFAEVIAAVRSGQSVVTAVREITGGKDGDAAIGALRAHKESHERLPAALEELAKVKAEAETKERTALIDEAINVKGTLAAQQRAWAESLTLPQLRGYLEVAVPAVPGGGSAPPKQPRLPAGDDSLTADELEMCRALKQTPEQFLKSKRALAGNAGRSAEWARAEAEDRGASTPNGAKSATEK